MLCCVDDIILVGEMWRRVLEARIFFFFSSGGSKAECVECKLKQEAHLLEE